MKQNSILNYFARTPKSSGNSSSNNQTTGSTEKKSPSNNNVSPKKSPGTKVTPTTPVSSRVQDSKRKSNAIENSSKKRPRPEDLSPIKEFSDGEVVWAKLEGYPWWPAMVRGEQKDSPCHRKGRTEYHVQFFDQPPSRAWLRKLDIKAFKGSSDGAVPPAKTDPNWLESCKYADGALGFSPKKRLEKYWVQFEELEDDKDPEDSEVEEDPKDVKSTPKAAARPKRRRIITDSSDDEDEATNGKANGDEDYSAASSSSGESEVEEIQEVDSDSMSEPSPSPEIDISKKPKRKQKIGAKSRLSLNDSSTTTPKGKSLVAKTLAVMKHNKPYRLSPIGSPKTPTSGVSSPRPSTGTANADEKDEDEGPRWTHLKLDFLKPENIMDKNRRRPDHPEYDPKTLYVPLSFKEKCTPAIRQWWDMKEQNYDTILFFKLGKFYELYNMDAIVAVQELGIDFMRGEQAHCGFPEIAYSKFATVLVEKGHKVARVEQTETPDMMLERCKKMGKTTKFDKVVRRELCQVTTKGVRYATFQDQLSQASFRPDASYLFAVTERTFGQGYSEVGVCFVDTTIGTFHIGQFHDDRHFSRLRTIFSHFSPAEILYEKNRLPPGIQALFSFMPTVSKEGLVPEREFWSDRTVLKHMHDEKYFWDENLERNVFPDNLKQFLSEDDHLCLTPALGYELGIKSLGAIVWYLKKCLIENDLLTMKRFERYQPVDCLDTNKDISIAEELNRPKFMVLDGVTLRNLDVNSGEGNLLSRIDFCSTAFGKRLLRSWVCMPLAIPDEISARLDAIEELLGLTDVVNLAASVLKGLPDLERLMSKVHTLGSKHRGKHHPDSRAFFFEEVKYSKRKVADLLSVLKGFKACVKIVHFFRDPEVHLQSEMLKYLIDDFPELNELLRYFDKAFNHEKAATDGKIIPSHGVDPEYDSLCDWQEQLKSEADECLREMGKKLQCKVAWFGSDKKRFQIEVPANVQVPHSFELSSSRKGFKRYYTKESKNLLERTLKADAQGQAVLKDLMRRVFEKVDTHRDTWRKVISTIAQLDALISLSRYARSCENMCRPVVKYSTQPFIDVENGWHPCVPQDSFIPNSSKLGPMKAEGDSKGVFTLLTGPNMGGKSTLMRQIGLLAVLSHIGSFVPADKCEMSVVDRIFTRVGAKDNISEGESTFYIEMSETASILKHATRDSLALIDELGRGTATFDGTALAYAVAKELLHRNSRCYFSTHYHSLVESLEHFPAIQLGHMACMVENENEDDPTEETITFLYKLVPGACPKSYGFNAARLAGLPNEVIRQAHKKAKEMEQQNSKLHLFRKLMTLKHLSLDDVKAIPS